MSNGLAIGIHTNAGCTAGGGSNSSTSLANAGVSSALVVPIGIFAAGAPPLRLSLTSELPAPAPPEGFTVDVAVVDRLGDPAAATSATLVYDVGGGDQMLAMNDLGGGLWRAILPPQTCGDEVLLRVNVEAAGGALIRHPFAAEGSADRRYRRRLVSGFLAVFRDDFETDQGWAVENDGSLTAGAWERGAPAGYGLRQDPPWDADSSGQCFLTSAPGGNTDVDGGATRLLSPLMDGTQGADPHLTYWRWWSDAGASDDAFVVELSNDDGASWVTLETLTSGAASGWVRRIFRVADFVTPSDQLRLRFTAEDTGGGDVIEAGVDGVALRDGAEGWSCMGDIFADGFEAGDTTSWTFS